MITPPGPTRQVVHRPTHQAVPRHAMLAKAVKTTPLQAPSAGQPVGGLSGRFARDPAEYATELSQPLGQALDQPRRHLAVVPDPTQEDPTP